MIFEGNIKKIYPKQSGESFHGKWQYVDAVVRNEETIIQDDGTMETILLVLNIRMWGKRADQFLKEKKAGDFISANVHPDCHERFSKNGVAYACNDPAFECMSWDTAPQV